MKNEFTAGSKTRTAEVIEGDIAAVPADAMITAINSEGMWFGGIDGVIQRHAGNMFHNQATAAMPLHHLDTVVARKRGNHTAKFGDVVFVIDDLKSPLNKVVTAALKAASKAGYRHVTMPTIRTGVMLGVVEKDAKTAVGELLRGIDNFFTEEPETSIEHFTFVIFRQPQVLAGLEADIRLITAN
jgi:O-acetyl-ADP-ribose deacetylase (regulator of RNase III)